MTGNLTGSPSADAARPSKRAHILRPVRAPSPKRSAHQPLRLAFKRIAQVDDASSGLLRRMPMLARHLFTARKEDEIDADKRTRLDPLNERHFVTNGFELAQCNVVVHQQKISGAEGRFAQSVVQFL